MGYKIERLFFGDDYLEVQSNTNSSSQHLSLYLAGTLKKVRGKRTLELFEMLLRSAPRACMDEDIIRELWKGTSVENGTVYHYISELRKLLRGGSDNQRFIETVLHGYRFTVPVRNEVSDRADVAQPLEEKKTAKAETASIRAVEQWRDERFIEFLDHTNRGPDRNEDGDLRILTTAFTRGVPEESLLTLLERRVRIRILLTNATLSDARHKLRSRAGPAKARARLTDQWETLSIIKKQFAEGMLKVLETDVMPCGFVAHNRNGALIGLFLATESYARGPMIEVRPDTELWQRLFQDWKEMWKDAKKSAPRGQPGL